MSKNEEYQEYFADCYILTDKRDLTYIDEFLNSFIPNKIEMADEYNIPQYSETPKITFSTSNELIRHLTNNTNESYSIYWSNNNEGVITHAMCFFTNDNHLILGLSTKTKISSTEIEDTIFTELKKFANNSEGLITYEEPAPNNSIEFKKMILERKQVE